MKTYENWGYKKTDEELEACHKLINVFDVPKNCFFEPSTERRHEILRSLCAYSENGSFPQNSATGLVDISWQEELVCIFCFLIFPGGIIIAFFLYLALLIFQTWFALSLIPFLIFLSLLPASFWPQSLSSYPARAMIKYFSLRFIFRYHLQPDENYILIAPPHGVFPFGNILTMFAFPTFVGWSFRGLAASALLRVPVCRHLLVWIGIEDASRENVLELLNKQKVTVGLTPGGISEIFETNSQHEMIVLRKRYGIVKAAIQSGVPLVPCYLFGNTRALSLWYDNRGFLRTVSRKLKISIFFFWGRFGLPIPYRVPITGVLSEPIRVEKCENPTNEQVEQVMQRLIDGVQKVFDQHKDAYGWGDVELFIK